jgi:hypothetical protein
MKKFLKNAGLQIGVFALAIGAAFATNAMKNADPNDRMGYHFDEEAVIKCIPKGECTIIQSDELCTWQETPILGHQLYDLNGTSCDVKLYKKE